MRKLIATIPYEEVKFKYVSNHWDVHLKGTCIYNNQVCEFENDYPTDDEPMLVRIYEVDVIKKLNNIKKQFMFERCVGYHWSYPNRKNTSFHYRKPKWLYKLLFKMYYTRMWPSWSSWFKALGCRPSKS